ncbi:hypothetical protein Pfo_011489 [Paulownia fortunei]|nr:hypothetical protein Pfo_011489 [Paulownia fortunei]
MEEESPKKVVNTRQKKPKDKNCKRLVALGKKFSPMMRRSYDLDDTDFATAIAASAHAIHSLEEVSSQVQLTKANTRKQEPYRPPQGGSIIRKPPTKDTRTSSFLRPPFLLLRTKGKRKLQGDSEVQMLGKKLRYQRFENGMKRCIQKF